jgi:cytochrome c-type biogenesis protein
MEALISTIEIYRGTAIALSFAAAFAGGVLTSFTPCVYPMIPLTVGYACANNVGGSKLRSFTLSLVYLLQVAVIYTALGIFAAVSGRFFGEVERRAAYEVAL